MTVRSMTISGTGPGAEFTGSSSEKISGSLILTEEDDFRPVTGQVKSIKRSGTN